MSLPVRALIAFVLCSGLFLFAMPTGCGGSDTTTNNPPPDASTSCTGGQTTCGGVCVNTSSDNNNCGTCGNKCGFAQQCTAGACAIMCGAGQKACGSACVDVQNDNANCGDCGKACPAGQVCSGGACGTTCANGERVCGGGDGGAAHCTDVGMDPNNCGACGHACPKGDACLRGVCTLECPAPLLKCTPDAGGAYCANPQSDNQNCGMCGNACPNGEACVSGTCQCGMPNVLCAPDGGVPYCANTQGDNQNCGTCGNICPPGTACSLGKCSVTCAPPEVLCPGLPPPPDAGADAGGTGPYCANTQTDNANCGTCGNVCTAGQSCVNGMCNNLCNPPLIVCPTGCVDPRNDPMNCGKCGNVCMSGNCTNGMCTVSVAIVHSEQNPGWIPALQMALMGTGNFTSVDAIDVNMGQPTPTVAQLKNYIAVLVFSDFQFGDPVGLGNVLADYFDAGGQVVLALGAMAQGFNLQGKFMTTYNLIPVAPYVFSAGNLGMVQQPNSPLMKGVMTFSAQTGLRDTTMPTNGGMDVAQWNDGNPLIVSGVVKGRNRADLNFFPIPNSVFQGGWTGDGAVIMANALLYK